MKKVVADSFWDMSREKLLSEGDSRVPYSQAATYGTGKPERARMIWITCVPCDWLYSYVLHVEMYTSTVLYMYSTVVIFLELVLAIRVDEKIRRYCGMNIEAVTYAMEVLICLFRLDVCDEKKSFHHGRRQ